MMSYQSSGAVPLACDSSSLSGSMGRAALLLVSMELGSGSFCLMLKLTALFFSMELAAEG